MLLLLLFSCLRSDGLPAPGDCAKIPDKSYTWGEIGIGTCLAGPNTLAFAGDADAPTLLVVNADPFLSFTGGSLLALPWSDLDLDEGRNLVSDLDASAVDLPDFASGLGLSSDGLGLVPVRLSDARTRASYDDVWLIDLSDPSSPALSDRGTDGGETVEVQSDPVGAAVDDATGYAFVGNRTSHTVSILDLTDDEVAAVPPWPDQAVRIGPFVDTDGSGSRADLAEVDIDDDTALTDDLWTFSWVEGAWRLWVSADAGIQRFTTTGADLWPGGLGTELDVRDYDGEYEAVSDPAFFSVGSLTRLYFADQGVIRGVDMGDYLGEWVEDTDTALEGDSEGWDATVSGPSAVLDQDLNIWMFYDGTDGSSWGIGEATSADGLTFRRAGAAVLEPQWDFEAERISDPYVIWDPQVELYQMYYSAYDGLTWTIGHATSADLESWTSDDTPIFAVDGVDVAAPAVAVQNGLFRMWYARRDGPKWAVGAATSPDGVTWTDLGEVASLEHNTALSDEPPGPGLYAQSFDSFQGEGEAAGRLLQPLLPGYDYTSTTFGWTVRAVVGFHLSPFDVGTAGWGGVSVDSVDEDDGLAWLSLTSRAGDLSIGAATLDADGRLIPARDAVLEAGDDGFDQDGVTSPVVFVADDEYRMLYAGIEDDVPTIGLATSDDGLTWTKQGQVLDVVTDAWDGAGLAPGSVEELDDGRLRLWYSGTNGDDLRIGSALSDDGGLTWTREELDQSKPWSFPAGAPGDWDDSGVRDPYLVRTDDGDHLYYAGYDGETWRIGHAFRASEDDAWQRAQDEVAGEPRAVFGINDGLFHVDGVRRPVASYDGTDWSLWFAGYDAEVSRVGKARGRDPERLHEIENRPTLGDVLQFDTKRGDEDAEAIPLDTTVEGRSVTGEGLTSVAMDEARGMLYVATSHTNYIYAIDVRDDSADGAPDTNYLDVEAILLYEPANGGAGFRSLLVSGDRLYALNDSPEVVAVFDLGRVVDDGQADVLHDAVLGTITMPLAGDGDRGVDTVANIGPGGLALAPDGRRLFVTNFNDNSISLVDLSLGTVGQLTTTVSDVGENPYAIAISPDGAYAVVANYRGEVNDDLEVSSTLAVLDIDETSPTYLEVLTWVVNR